MDQSPPENTAHIYLIGFMGAGKSWTGQRLAKLLQRDFLDLDDCIERSSSKSIQEIFADHGEAHFRQLESKTLRQLAELDAAVISCGGGTPCQNDNIDWMNANGTTVFLDVAEDILVDRLSKAFAHRPLLAKQTNLQQFIINKLEERRSFYEQATHHIIINEDHQPVEKMILKKLGL